MEFRLTYDGELLAATSGNLRPEHKHKIRRQFHPQLKRLWEIYPHLSILREAQALHEIRVEHVGGRRPSRIRDLANRFACGGYHLVPLVTEDLELICSVDILFLRPDPPGCLIRSGDIDNRLKVLFDALRIPSDAKELAGAVPTADENPFYCLLQDDKLITRIAISTDVLLQPVEGKAQLDKNDVRLIITVNLRPTKATWASIDYL